MISGEEKINSILNKTTKIIDPVMERLLSLYVDRKNQKIVKYQILTGGKRLRPTLTIISCQLLGGKIKDVILPAAGLEILHNYTLIIDDIIDNSILRRGKPTVWTKFGRSIAECVGMDYSAAIFQAANFSKEPVKISELFSKILKIIVEGEILDILFEQNGRENESYVVENRYRKITKKDYLGMISKKTASLFEASCELGGICSGSKEEEISALKNYGFNLGIAFQITDDILDIFGEGGKFEKKIGKDIEERKGGNIVIYFASQRFSFNEKEKFWQILRKENITQKDINQGINLIRKTKAKEKSLNYAKKFIEKAKGYLNLLPQNKWNKILADIADFIIEREK